MFRRLIATVGIVVAGAAVGAVPTVADMRGPFPIMSTPYFEKGEVDYGSLIREARWVDDCGCPGVIWCQSNDAVDLLTETEKFLGFEACAKAVEGRKVTLALGANGTNATQMLKMAAEIERVAERHPTAKIAMVSRPPDDVRTEAALEAAWDALGKVAKRPVILQTFCSKETPTPSVELLVRLAKKHPHAFGYVKEEASGDDVLTRMIAENAAKPAMKAVFSGWGGWKWLIQMRQCGSVGLVTERCAVAPILGELWRRYERGERGVKLAEAYAMYRLLIDQRDFPGGMRGYALYLLQKGGVFKNRISRQYKDAKVTEGGSFGASHAWKLEDVTLTDLQKAELDLLYKDMMDFCGQSAAEPQRDFREIIRETGETVFPSLVYIRVVREDLSDAKNEKQVVSGSGIVITEDGELLTNHHVVDKATEIRCLLAGGEAYSAKVVGFDKDMDVALLKLECGTNAPPFKAAKLSPEPVKTGDVVLAMGAPWGLARSVTMGIVSCTDRYLDGAGQYTLWYQTDAAISPGNSGGPLVDTEGTVVGLNARGVLFGGQAFTIPSPSILEILPYLRTHGNAYWSWFGFKFQPLNDFNRNMRFPYETGVMVAGTDGGSPARKAGFLPNDHVTAIDGKSVKILNAEDLPAFERKLGRRPFGKDVAFAVERGGTNLVLKVAPCEKGKVEGEQKAYERWGFTAKEINVFAEPDLAFFASEGGLYVAATSWEGNASVCGLRRKDVILALDGKPVKTLADLDPIYDAALKDLPGKYKMRVTVSRKGREMQFVLNYLEDTEKEDVE